MKSNIIFRATVAASVIAAAMMSASCTKELEAGTNPSAQEGRVITINVQDTRWTDDSKSAYVSGEGVGLTGTEKLHLYYFDGEKKVDAGLATPTGEAGQYSFTVPSGVEEGTMFYSMMPYNKTAMNLNGKGTSVCTRLSPVQNPGADTFDPCFDYLAGKPFELSGETATIGGFKRFFAPLRMTVTGLESGDKIYTARLSFNQEPQKADNQAMTSSFYIQLGDTFDETLVSNPDAMAMGNAVSALYANGLSADGEGWPVWFIVNPITVQSGATMVVEISTASKTYTREIELSSDMVMTANSLNKFSVDFSSAKRGEGSECETFNFTNATALNTSAIVKGSAGSSVTWNFSGNVLYNNTSKDPDSGLSNAMNVNAQSFTVPKITGKNVTNLQIYTHVATNYNGTPSYLYLKNADGDVLATYDYNFYTQDGASSNLYADGGCITIALPDGYKTMTDLTVEGNSRANLISAITLFTEDSGEVGPEEATGNDLWTEFNENGKKITINGVAYYKEAFPDANLISSDSMDDLRKAGVHFVEGSYAVTGKTNVAFANGTVLIGRYRNSQPTVSVGNQIQVRNNLAFKNINITVGNATASFTDASTTVSPELVIEDCQVSSVATAALVREVGSALSFSKIVLKNCVVSAMGTLYELKTSTASQLEEVSVTNTVLYGTSAMALSVFNYSAATYDTDNCNFTFNNNTVYNYIAPDGGYLFKFKGIAKLSMNKNVFAGAVASDITLLQASSATTGSTANLNWMYNAGGTGSYATKDVTGVTYADNTLDGTNPFASESTDNGYLPINTTVVTTGAGASYDTKLWKTWE